MFTQYKVNSSVQTTPRQKTISDRASAPRLCCDVKRFDEINIFTLVTHYFRDKNAKRAHAFITATSCLSAHIWRGVTHRCNCIKTFILQLLKAHGNLR